MIISGTTANLLRLVPYTAESERPHRNQTRHADVYNSNTSECLLYYYIIQELLARNEYCSELAFKPAGRRNAIILKRQDSLGCTAVNKYWSVLYCNMLSAGINWI